MLCWVWVVCACERGQTKTRDKSVCRGRPHSALSPLSLTRVSRHHLDTISHSHTLPHPTPSLLMLPDGATNLFPPVAHMAAASAPAPSPAADRVRLINGKERIVSTLCVCVCVFPLSTPEIKDYQTHEKKNSPFCFQPEASKAVLYWMSRDQRVCDNWALVHAFHVSVARRVPLLVCFCLVPKFLEATERQYGFMLKGASACACVRVYLCELMCGEIISREKEWASIYVFKQTNKQTNTNTQWQIPT